MSTPVHAQLADELTEYLRETSAARGRPFTTLDPRAAFFDTGVLDSLSLLDFVSHIERRYQIPVPGPDIAPENFGSLAAVVAYLHARLRPPHAP